MMKKIRAVIIEDEPEAKFMLQVLIEKYCPEVQVIGDASNVKEGVALIQKLLPDLVFLDIEMPGEKGLYLFKYFEEINFEVIFTTAYDQYAINALRLSALDYLLKPIDLEELRASIVQFKKKQNTQQLYESLHQQLSSPSSAAPKRLALPSKNSFVFLEVNNIMYCLADGSYTTFVCNKHKKYLVAKSMKEYASLLEDLGFVRVHRSAIVNLNYVERLIRTRPQSIVMEDGTSIAIARSRSQYLIDRLTQF
ncbi:LytR/AlgR family response regulator transcription factor [Aureispira anguillae]|uniref:LytTR family DNA-binding domain-containing protein n=1 Tax=Aureispira anguillae TaxID=2864201 RepID=A0A915VMJ7_9BACT|nr:LytTR family DNA-binding domain-containing protein [Aureispira anguillae]BDS09595.1 LytTR family DNA-binding domain-containing protein [Aureispira anguillae]